jgi:hypothetical protein
LDSSIEDNAFYEDWIRLGTEKDVDFSSYVSVDNELATCSMSSINELCNDREGGGSSEEEEEGDKRGPEPVPSFTEAHTAFETVKSFFYAYSIGEHDEQVILNLELVLFHLKQKVSTKELPIADFFGEKVIFTHVTFYFLFCRPKWKMYSFHFLLFSRVSDTFNAFPQLLFSSVYRLFSLSLQK